MMVNKILIDDKLLGCTRSQLLVLMILDQMGVEGRAEVSFSELAHRSRMSLRTVTNAVAVLLSVGLIIKVDQGGSDGRRNIYAVLGNRQI